MSTYNTNVQNYRGLPLQLVFRQDYQYKFAKEFYIINKHGHKTNSTIWIPNRFLSDDGSIDEKLNFMFIFKDKNKYEKIQSAGFKFKY